MARFQYRLQKVYELRERKKKEQERRVQEAYARVRAIEAEIETKKREVREVRHSMTTSHHTLLPIHDNYLYKLNQELGILFEDLAMAKQHLEVERKKLIQAQAELEALVKHKEKAYETWQEEEKRAEMKQLDEVASQRYFRDKQAERLAEEAAAAENAT